MFPLNLKNLSAKPTPKPPRSSASTAKTGSGSRKNWILCSTSVTSPATSGKMSIRPPSAPSPLSSVASASPPLRKPSPLKRKLRPPLKLSLLPRKLLPRRLRLLPPPMLSRSIRFLPSNLRDRSCHIFSELPPTLSGNPSVNRYISSCCWRLCCSSATIRG